MFQTLMSESAPHETKWIWSGAQAISQTSKIEWDEKSNNILTVLMSFPSFLLSPIFRNIWNFIDQDRCCSLFFFTLLPCFIFKLKSLILFILFLILCSLKFSDNLQSFVFPQYNRAIICRTCKESSNIIPTNTIDWTCMSA